MPNGERSTTIVAPQALFVLNSKLVADESQHLAISLLARSDLDDAGRIRALYERAFGRLPTSAEIQRAIEFVRRYNEAVQLPGEQQEREVKAWRGLCRAFFGSNEFLFIE